MIIYENVKGSWLDDLDHGENKYCVQIRPCLFIIINHCLFYYQSLPFLVLLDDVVTMFFTKIIRLSGQMRVIDPRATQRGVSTFYFSRNEYDKFAHRSD